MIFLQKNISHFVILLGICGTLPRIYFVIRNLLIKSILCLGCRYRAASSCLGYLCSVSVIMVFSNIDFGALLPVGSCEMLNAAKFCVIFAQQQQPWFSVNAGASLDFVLSLWID